MERSSLYYTKFRLLSSLIHPTYRLNKILGETGCIFYILFSHLMQAYAPYERPALTKAYLFPLEKKPARLPVSMVFTFIVSSPRLGE